MQSCRLRRCLADRDMDHAQVAVCCEQNLDRARGLRGPLLPRRGACGRGMVMLCWRSVGLKRLAGEIYPADSNVRRC